MKNKLPVPECKPVRVGQCAWACIALWAAVIAVAVAATGCRTIEKLVDKYGDKIDLPTEGEPDKPADPGKYDLALTVTSLSHSQVGFSWEPRPYEWPVKAASDGSPLDAVVEMRRADGRGGKYDWIRKGGQSSKGLKNIHEGYGVWREVGLPASGERVTFRWVSVDGTKRSNDAEAVWP